MPCPIPDMSPSARKAQQDFIGCMMTAALACLPYFLEAFVKCISGGGSSGGDTYKPGDRNRCD